MTNESRGWRRRGRTILDPLRQAWGEYQRDYAFLLAPAMVYYALLSLVPLLLLSLSVLGLLLRYSEFANATEREVLSAVETRFGAELPAAISGMLDGLRHGSILATVVGFIGLVVAASVLFRNLRLSIHAIWKYEPPLASASFREMIRKKIRQEAISLAMALMTGLLFVVSLAVLAIVQWLGGLFSHLSMVADTAAWVLGLAGPLVVVTVTFAALFKFLPPVRVEWRHVLLPAVLSAVGWYITAELMALYGRFFGNDFSAYGALGGLLVIMLWMNVVSQLLLFGAELCKVLARSEPTFSA